jgi:molybdenum cofactor cytidylyltransferase
VAVAAVVLAAGRSSRFGGPVPKPLVEWRGRTLLDHALGAPFAAGTRPVLLVTGSGAGRVAAAAPPGVEVVHNRRWRRGLASSLLCALDALEPYAQVDAACIGLADQPLVGAGAYERLVAAHAGGAAFAVATYDGGRANPVLLARSIWPAARELTGDAGARGLMDRIDVVAVPCDGTGSPFDVDTPEDLGRLEDQADRFGI